MSVLYLVLPLALVLVATAVVAFVWSVRNGQLDDLESPAIRMLHDDDSAQAVPSLPARSADTTNPTKTARDQ